MPPCQFYLMCAKSGPSIKECLSFIRRSYDLISQRQNLQCIFIITELTIWFHYHEGYITILSQSLRCPFDKANWNPEIIFFVTDDKMSIDSTVQIRAVWLQSHFNNLSRLLHRTYFPKFLYYIETVIARFIFILDIGLHIRGQFVSHIKNQPNFGVIGFHFRFFERNFEIIIFDNHQRVLEEGNFIPGGCDWIYSNLILRSIHEHRTVILRNTLSYWKWIKSTPAIYRIIRTLWWRRWVFNLFASNIKLPGWIHCWMNLFCRFLIILQKTL